MTGITRREEFPDRLPGEVFPDAAGRTRRMCRHCGAVIPYGTHGGRQYCGAKCRSAAARKRRHTDPANLAHDRMMSREANRRAYRTPEGRERILAANRRYRRRKKEEAERA